MFINIDQYVLYFIFFAFMIVLDHIIGCVERHGNKYFLVRFKGQDKNEIIDWDTCYKLLNIG